MCSPIDGSQQVVKEGSLGKQASGNSKVSQRALPVKYLSTIIISF
ncbi:hypothetical protein [Lysinibacillus sp. 3P01SB]